MKCFKCGRIAIKDKSNCRCCYICPSCGQKLCNKNKGKQVIEDNTISKKATVRKFHKITVPEIKMLENIIEVLDRQGQIELHRQLWNYLERVNQPELHQDKEVIESERKRWNINSIRWLRNHSEEALWRSRIKNIFRDHDGKIPEYIFKMWYDKYGLCPAFCWFKYAKNQIDDYHNWKAKYCSKKPIPEMIKVKYVREVINRGKTRNEVVERLALPIQPMQFKNEQDSI